MKEIPNDKEADWNRIREQTISYYARVLAKFCLFVGAAYSIFSIGLLLFSSDYKRRSFAWWSLLMIAGVLLVTWIGTLVFMVFDAKLAWRNKWYFIELIDLREYAQIFREKRSLSSQLSSEKEGEERRQFLNTKLSFFTNNEEILKQWNRWDVMSLEEKSILLAIFADAKALIGRELAVVGTKQAQTSTLLDFLNIEGEAFIEYEGQAVKRITAKIGAPGEFVLKWRNGDKDEFSEAIASGEVRRAFSTPLESGELWIQNLDERVIERIPLP